MGESRDRDSTGCGTTSLKIPNSVFSGGCVVLENGVRFWALCAPAPLEALPTYC